MLGIRIHLSKFQFHLVRLKEKQYDRRNIGSIQFQFHLVRLKEEWDLIFALIAENFNSI